jgi:hypothetical protein
MWLDFFSALLDVLSLIISVFCEDWKWSIKCFLNFQPLSKTLQNVFFLHLRLFNKKQFFAKFSWSWVLQFHLNQAFLFSRYKHQFKMLTLVCKTSEDFQSKQNFTANSKLNIKVVNVFLYDINSIYIWNNTVVMKQ